MQSRLEAAYAERARRNFFEFFKSFWSTIEAGELLINWHIPLICNELQKVYEAWERKEHQPDVLINLPFGVSKSTILQLYEAWLMLRNPAIKVLGTSYTGSLSNKNLSKAKKCLTSTKFLHWYGDRVVLTSNKATQFDTTALGIYYTASTNGAATGNHADFIINDDPLNVKQANSAKLRETANKFLGEALYSRKTDKARTVTITVMQRLHEDDPSGMLLGENLPLNHICLPGELTEATRKLVKPQSAIAHYEAYDNLLDPVRFTRAMMQVFKVKLGPYGYAAQVLQNPADAGAGIFKKDWFDVINWNDFLTLTNGHAVTWHFDADTAFTKERSNDPTALLATAYVDNILYVRDASTSWLEWDELLASLPKFLEKNQYDPLRSQLFLEPKANGLNVFQSLSKAGNINAAKAPSPSKDKVERAHDVVPFCAAKRVVFIDGSYLHGFMAELFSFPNAAHDDRVDTLTQAIARAQESLRKPKKQFRSYSFDAE